MGKNAVVVSDMFAEVLDMYADMLCLPLTSGTEYATLETLAERVFIVTREARRHEE